MGCPSDTLFDLVASHSRYLTPLETERANGGLFILPDTVFYASTRPLRDTKEVMPHILHVVGARPNFMKAAPVVDALSLRDGVLQTLIHTGQHYDDNMSEIFFRELGMPRPDVDLEVGSGSHATQTAEIMIRFERTVASERPDLVLVYGDVNSTIAATLVCAKLSIPVGHVEAGLRSFDRTMPEEINRLATDQLADLTRNGESYP